MKEGGGGGGESGRFQGGGEVSGIWEEKCSDVTVQDPMGYCFSQKSVIDF